MVNFRAMRDDEFSDYESYFISDYTEEISKNFKVSRESAAEIAKTELACDLPDGTRTEGQFLLCILDDKEGVENDIGYIWYNRVEGSEKVFICDFHILPLQQSQGFGKLALAHLDIYLANLGVRQIRLRVAIENKIALHVYESSGFRATGINMFKEISSENNS